MRKPFICTAATLSVAAIIVTGFSGCAPKNPDGAGSSPAVVATNRVDPEKLAIRVTKWHIGRGSWNIDTSTDTGSSEGSLGEQQVLVADLTMTNNSDVETIISPIDKLTATQGGSTLQFGSLYDSKGKFKNPEAKTVEPGQTVSGIAIWNIDDLNTPVEVKFKCGDMRTVTVTPAEDA